MLDMIGLEIRGIDRLINCLIDRLGFYAVLVVLYEVWLFVLKQSCIKTFRN